MAISEVRGSSDRSVLVLASLAGGPKHGYALIQDVREFAGVRLGPGTLYGCLSKLEAAGFVEALPAEDRRHPYRITANGVEMLRRQLSESARIAEIGLGRIEGTMA
ncbi:MAG: PadR family transcriptional regulator [Acidimicrobiales bacterium]